MSEANKVQIGGDHYKTGGEEHWDRQWRLFGHGYFVGCITKYVERYKKKNGLQDLMKARHFLDKLIELEGGVPTVSIEIKADKALADAVKNQPIPITEEQFIHTIVSKDGESLPYGWQVEGRYGPGDLLYNVNGQRVRGSSVSDVLAKLGQVGEATPAYVNQGDHP